MKELLESDEEQVLSASLKSLGEQAEMESFRTFVKLSLHDSPTVRRNAVLAMGYLPPNAVKKQVQLVCTDSDPLVQLSAAVEARTAKSLCSINSANVRLHSENYGRCMATARVLG